MTSEKCIHRWECGNFCSRCGTVLREKCPECGEMEGIGRPGCETAYNKIRKGLQDYKKGKPVMWSIVTLTLCFSPFGLTLYADINFFKRFTGNEVLVVIFAFMAIGVIIFVPAAWHWEKRRLTKKEKKFWEQNPEFKIEWDKWHQ